MRHKTWRWSAKRFRRSRPIGSRTTNRTRWWLTMVCLAPCQCCRPPIPLKLVLQCCQRWTLVITYPKRPLKVWTNADRCSSWSHRLRPVVWRVKSAGPIGIPPLGRKWSGLRRIEASKVKWILLIGFTILTRILYLNRNLFSLLRRSSKWLYNYSSPSYFFSSSPPDPP